MLCCFVLKFLANWNSDLDSHKGFCSSWKSFQKPLLNNSPPSHLRPYILTIGIKSLVLEKYSSVILKLFLWLENYLLRRVLQLTNHLCFVVWIISIGKLEWKSLLNPLIKEFGMQLKMALSFLRLKRVDLLLKNLGLNGLMKKVRRPSLIALPKI